MVVGDIDSSLCIAYVIKFADLIAVFQTYSHTNIELHPQWVKDDQVDDAKENMLLSHKIAW